MSTARRLVAVGSGLALLTLGLGPAVAPAAPAEPLTRAPASARSTDHASVVRVIDPLGDLWAPVEQNGAYGPAWDRVDGDLTALRIAHKPHRVALLFTAATLPRPATDHYDVMFAGSDIRTSGGRYYATYYRDSESELVVVGRAGREPTACRGARSSTSWSDATVRVAVPRSCLGRPRWVQVAAALGYAWPDGGDGDFFIDGAPGSDDPTAGTQPWSDRAWHPAG